jgi:hypothetical protein
MLALYVYTPLTLAQALVITGKPDEAKRFYDAAIDLAPSDSFAKRLTMQKAIAMGDIGLLPDPTLPVPAELRAALLGGHRAKTSRDSGARATAIGALLALPENLQGAGVAKLLAELGATPEAFRIAARVATTREYPGPSIFWDRSMRATLDDPGFAAVVEQLGLANYWRTSRTRPDVCAEKSPPPFCAAVTQGR